MPRKPTLSDLCHSANKLAFREYGTKSSCIHTSLAINDVLTVLGIESQVIRAEAGAFPEDRGRYAVVLGGDGDGTRRPKTDGWHGHLCVLAHPKTTLMHGDILIDATIDQVELPYVVPYVGRVHDGWLTDGRSHVEFFGPSGEGTRVRWNVHHRQNGWKSTPAARMHQRRALVDRLCYQFRDGLTF